MLLNVNQATLREYWKQTIRKAERKHGAEAAEQMLGTLHEGQKPTLFLRWLEINGPTMTMEMAADRLDTTTRSIHKMIERALDRKDPRMPAIEHRRRRAA